MKIFWNICIRNWTIKATIEAIVNQLFHIYWLIFTKFYVYNTVYYNRTLNVRSVYNSSSNFEPWTWGRVKCMWHSCVTNHCQSVEYWNFPWNWRKKSSCWIGYTILRLISIFFTLKTSLLTGHCYYRTKRVNVDKTFKYKLCIVFLDIT